MAKEREYEKLPGRGMRRGGFIVLTATFSRLWLGKDHLLLIDSNSFAESYKRFAFRDIQAVTLTRTWRRTWLNVLFLLPGTGFLLPVFFIEDDTGKIVFGAIAAIFFILALVNSLGGPTCRCELITAVQTDELASLRRVSRANKVLARLRPMIAAAQSEAAFAAPRE